eukprot:TRINITY_DN17470_c0_g1_i3.p2 TRINITY_DN17470_c0_g1~~TRINITY_DN17470_c0_g1_i3.p2  ORF type:complete len:454 (+),score=55.27 TRINITY_DN17470_c0_g1_i3:55-1416(+)
MLYDPLPLARGSQDPYAAESPPHPRRPTSALCGASTQPRSPGPASDGCYSPTHYAPPPPPPPLPGSAWRWDVQEPLHEPEPPPVAPQKSGTIYLYGDGGSVEPLRPCVGDDGRPIMLAGGRNEQLVADAQGNLFAVPIGVEAVARPSAGDQLPVAPQPRLQPTRWSLDGSSDVDIPVVPERSGRSVYERVLAGRLCSPPAPRSPPHRGPLAMPPQRLSSPARPGLPHSPAAACAVHNRRLGSPPRPPMPVPPLPPPQPPPSPRAAAAVAGPPIPPVPPWAAVADGAAIARLRCELVVASANVGQPRPAEPPPARPPQRAAPPAAAPSPSSPVQGFASPRLPSPPSSPGGARRGDALRTPSPDGDSCRSARSGSEEFLPCRPPTATPRFQSPRTSPAQSPVPHPATPTARAERSPSGRATRNLVSPPRRSPVRPPGEAEPRLGDLLLSPPRQAD